MKQVNHKNQAVKLTSICIHGSKLSNLQSLLKKIINMVLTLFSMGGGGIMAPYSFSSISLERLELRASNFPTFSFDLLAVRKI